MSNAINNVLQVVSEDQSRVVALTSFDGGSDPDEFIENYDVAVKSLITMDEFDLLKEEKQSYVPHVVFYRNKTPLAWEIFVEKDLEKFESVKADRTVIVVRCFELTEDNEYVPVHVDVEDHIKMPQIMTYNE